MRSYLRVVAALCAALFVLPVTPAGADVTAAALVEARVAGGRLQRWSDPATWGGSIPGPRDRVRIPSSARVVLDTSTPALGGLFVDGLLRFARKDLELSSRFIMVHGALRIGSRKRPFLDRAVITLTGPASDADVMGMGTKALGVMGGVLDIHGRRVRGWTKLAQTARPGDRVLTLTNAPAWRVGDRIALASSDYWDHHDEERTITAVSGKTIELDRGLEYRHWGELQTYDGRVLDERAEVGLLTRNITIRGDSSSEESGFGGHTMIMGGGRARIDGVEFAAMGQKKRMARYPVHFHLDGSAPKSYVRRSSIHDSFNRCVTIHGTHQLRVLGNVCHEHLGHGFFLEDGIETDNVIKGNLGFGTLAVKDGLLPTDERPATFWITNPDNVVKRNVAAGSDSIGFWYALPEHPTGHSAHATNVWPRRTPLKSFAGNVAHSNGNRGLEVDHGPRPNGTTEATWYRPVADPSDRDSDPVVARFRNFTAYFNRDRGIWLRGAHHIVEGAVLADNRAGATFASEETFIEDSLVVGESTNPGQTESWEDTGVDGRALPFFWEPDAPIIGFEFYDGRVGVRSTTFASFRHDRVRQSGALGYLSPDAFSIHPKNFAEGVSFIDSVPVYLPPVEAGMDGDASKVFIDRDGSVTGTPGRAVVADNPFLLDGSCMFRSTWNAHVCKTDYVTLLLESAGGAPADIKPLELTRGDGIVQTLMGCCNDSRSAVTSVIAGGSYGLGFNGGTPSDVKLVLWRGRDRSVVLSLPVAGAFTVTRWGYPIPSRSGLTALESSDRSSYYYDATGETLHLKMVGSNTDWEEIRVKS